MNRRIIAIGCVLACLPLVLRRSPLALARTADPVKQGLRSLLLLGAANHDPAVFTRPSELDVGRREAPPLSRRNTLRAFAAWSRKARR